ncbi:hypothetical protein COU79_03910 [Candidatus Peregrinibacteria bacterium CG10_big_fil_rev_8_21_14_0_10_54_7]|nr:MAG: hypothetical protein COU79_03910 [Candidatus Peregrinibacteria bacterium CG10_big_fil_rev_8_21_14_0_10_54_7]
MAIVPPLIALSYSAIHSEVPEMIQKMQVIPSYPSVQEGMIGDDLYQRFLSARAWADGLSPYKEVPIQYLYLGQSVPFYPPVTYWLYSKIVPLGYKAVYIIHTVVKIAVFLAAVSWVLWAARAKSLIPLTVFVCLSCILLSPVGRTELWVGQFEYFVASAYALVFAMLFCKRMMWIPAAGVLASIKISSLTFIAPFSLVALLSDRRRSVGAVSVLAVMLGILVLFFPYLLDFSRHIVAHEFVRTELYYDRVPYSYGISFFQILPYYVGKGIILLSVAIVLIVLCRGDSRHRAEAFLAASFPFAVMLMLEGAGFGTRSYAYKGVTFLALLPGLYLWLEAKLIPTWFQRLVTVLFTVLIACLLNLYPLRPSVLLGNRTDLVWVYLYASGLFFVLTLMAMRLRSDDDSTYSRNP